jgi:hypothetical protein
MTKNSARCTKIHQSTHISANSQPNRLKPPPKDAQSQYEPENTQTHAPQKVPRPARHHKQFVDPKSEMTKKIQDAQKSTKTPISQPILIQIQRNHHQKMRNFPVIIFIPNPTYRRKYRAQPDTTSNSLTQSPK